MRRLCRRKKEKEVMEDLGIGREEKKENELITPHTYLWDIFLKKGGRRKK